jgi:large subunit ribosomal protein L29
MKSSEIRNLTDDQLRARLSDTREELMKLRFQLASGGLTDFTRLRYTRRDIARLETILNEREGSAAKEGEA